MFNTSSYIIVWTNQRQACQATNLAPPTMAIHVCVIPPFSSLFHTALDSKAPLPCVFIQKIQSRIYFKVSFSPLEKITFFLTQSPYDFAENT